jgi:fibronectin-binding autotransporter adhesin
VTFDGFVFDLTAPNTFTGDVTLRGGALNIHSDASLGNAANKLILGDDSNPSGVQLYLIDGINVARHVIINAWSGIEFPTYASISGPISGAGSLHIAGWDDGTLRLSNPSNSFTGGVFVSHGTLAIAADGALGASSSPVTVERYGTLQYSSSTATSRTFNVHNGTIDLGGHPLDLNGALLVNNGAVRTGTVNVNDGSTTKGTGSYDVVHVADGGVFAPGNSVGVATANSVSFDSGSLLSSEFAGAAPAQYDQLHVTGRLSFGGTLDVSLISPFMPQAGNSFDILDWGSLTGTFDNVTLPALGPELMWDTSQLYVNGALAVTIAGDFNGDGSVNGADLTN